MFAGGETKMAKERVHIPGLGVSFFVIPNCDTPFLIGTEFIKTTKSAWDELYRPLRDGERVSLLFKDGLYYVRHRELAA